MALEIKEDNTEPTFIQHYSNTFTDRCPAVFFLLFTSQVRDTKRLKVILKMIFHFVNVEVVKIHQRVHCGCSFFGMELLGYV
jgi:hypothetical protein